MIVMKRCYLGDCAVCCSPRFNTRPHGLPSGAAPRKERRASRPRRPALFPRPRAPRQPYGLPYAAWGMAYILLFSFLLPGHEGAGHTDLISELVIRDKDGAAKLLAAPLARTPLLAGLGTARVIAVRTARGTVAGPDVAAHTLGADDVIIVQGGGASWGGGGGLLGWGGMAPGRFGVGRGREGGSRVSWVGRGGPGALRWGRGEDGQCSLGLRADPLPRPPAAPRPPPKPQTRRAPPPSQRLRPGQLPVCHRQRPRGTGL